MSRGGRAALPRGATGCLQFVIVVFPDHTHLLFSKTESLKFTMFQTNQYGRKNSNLSMYSNYL